MVGNFYRMIFCSAYPCENLPLDPALADPALTGQVLGILCMMPFLYQYDFHIFPDFESESYYIRGSYDMKGRIQLIFLLITFIRIVADKDLRCFLKKILDKR